MEEIRELKQCSRCHSNVLLEHFELNRQGVLFKTCNNCRHSINTKRRQHYQEHIEEITATRRENTKQYYHEQKQIRDALKERVGGQSKLYSYFIK